MITAVYAIGVSLTVYGPQVNDSSINLCPDQDYVLVVHCSVTGSSSFLWALAPFIVPSVTFIRSHDLGKISRPPVTLVLTEKTLTDKDMNHNSKFPLLILEELLLIRVVVHLLSFVKLVLCRREYLKVMY